MKRTIAFIAVIALCQTFAFGQKKYEMVVETADGNSVTFPTEFIKRIYFRESNVSYKECPDDNHPHLIDLGLPSGTLWACCNIGASKPEDYGNYYAWGETQPKEVYNPGTYTYSQNDSWVNIGSDIGGTDYDAATVNWGAPWRMPSDEQCKELLNCCTSVWTQQNGVTGEQFTGPNGGAIFLPAASLVWNDELGSPEHGSYWSSTFYESQDPYYAGSLQFYSYGMFFQGGNRSGGQPIRPVRKN